MFYSIKKIASVFSIVFSFSQFAIAQKNGFKIYTSAVKNNISHIRVQDILMVGAGSTASRMFLENLHTALLADFKAINIQTDFLYLGKTERKNNIKFK